MPKLPKSEIFFRPKELTVCGLSSIQKELLQHLAQESHFSLDAHFRPDLQRAKKYARDLKDRVVGKLAYHKEFDADQFYESVKLSREGRSINVVTLFGAPGSAKSTSTRKAIQALGMHKRPGLINVICPRSNQMLDWESKIKFSYDFLCKTYESPLRQPCNSTVVVEEFGQTPPGWFDALLVARPNISLVILLGDPLQSREYIRHPEAQTRSLSANIDGFAQSRYKNDSYRLSRDQCQELGINWLGDTTRTDVIVTNKIRKDLAVLTTSESRATKLAASHPRVFTYQGSQGQDFKDDKGNPEGYTLQLTKDIWSMDDNSLFTAATRSPGPIYLHLEDEHLSSYSNHPSKIIQILLRMEGANFLGKNFSLFSRPGGNQFLEITDDKSRIAAAFRYAIAEVELNPSFYSKRDYPNLQHTLTTTTRFHKTTPPELAMLSRYFKFV